MITNSKIAHSRVDELRKQLAKEEESERLYHSIETARCPLCGSQLKSETSCSESFYTSYITGSIYCSKCGVFGTKVELKDELSSNNKGYDELTALRLAWTKMSNYVKFSE